jgi:RNA polymerase sigma factor (sigma-70 family)
MEEEFYLKSFELFCKVAGRINKDLVQDKNLCRSIFHERVLFPPSVKLVDESAARLQFDSGSFETSKAYTNWLYTIFKNAILDHFRWESKRKEVLRTVPVEVFDSVADPNTQQPGEDQSVLETRAESVVSKFSREERRLLTLRYLEGKTQEEVGRFFHVSTSTVSRWEATVRDKLASAIAKKKAELEEAQQLDLLGYILEKSRYEDAEK